MSDIPEKKWENNYADDSIAKQRIELSEEEKKMKLDNSIELINALQHELDLESNSKELVRKGLSQVSRDLESVRNGFMWV